MTVLFLVGAPGVGKTTLVRALLAGHALTLVSKPKWTLVGADICAAGHYTGAAFDGADTIAYNGAAAAFDYWRDELSGRRLTVLDGDRFSNSNALSWFQAAAFDVRCALLVVPEWEAQERRDERGSKQNPAWVKGRTTKAVRFAEKAGNTRVFNAACSLRTLRSQVLSWIEAPP